MTMFNIIVGIVGIAVTIGGLIYSFLSYVHAKGAEEKSNKLLEVTAEKHKEVLRDANDKHREIIQQLMKEIRCFDEFAKRVIQEFLVIEPGTTMMSLISPAFAALSRTNEQIWFNEYISKLYQIGSNNVSRKLLIIVTSTDTLLNWYKTLIGAMEEPTTKKIEIYDIVIKSMGTTYDRFKHLIEANKCKFKTRKTTPQILVRKDSITSQEKHVAGMFGFLASDHHEKVPEMLGKANPSYEEMVKLSKGVYSQIQAFVMEQEETFNYLWQEGKPLKIELVKEYFDQVKSGLENQKKIYQQKTHRN